MTTPERNYRFRTISFLSDYGYADEFVGVVHSVVANIAPEVRVIDITHGVPHFNIRAGALTLARSVEYMAPGVLLAVVDPGVGSNRKPVAVELADGAAYMVGPDNGLLSSAASLSGGATAAVVLDNEEYQLSAVGSSFDGRDVFGPAAAYLCLGVPLGELGSPLPTAQLTPGLLPVSELSEDGTIDAEVLWVDGFGNVQLNVEPSLVVDWPTLGVKTDAGRYTARRVENFGDAASDLGWQVDSNGLVALIMNQRSAAEYLGVASDDRIVLAPAEGSTEATPVVLGIKPT